MAITFRVGVDLGERVVLVVLGKLNGIYGNEAEEGSGEEGNLQKTRKVLFGAA